MFKPLLLALPLAAAAGAQSDSAWLSRYPGTGQANYQPLASFVDDTGNVCVVGWTGEWEEPSGAFILKVDSLGRLVGARTYDSVEAMGAVWDTSGNIYIAGGEEGGRVCLLKYGPDGTMEWLATYGGADDYSTALGSIAIDNSQNVYAGSISTSASGQVVHILKYRPNGRLAGMMSGALVWERKRRHEGHMAWHPTTVGLDRRGALYDVGFDGGNGGVYVLKYRTR